MTERRRLLVLTSTFPRSPGDATPGFVADLSLRLSGRFDVTVLAPAVPGAPGRERWGELTVRRFRYGWPEPAQRLADGAILPNLRSEPRLWAQVPPFIGAQSLAALRLARRQRFDAVHAHWVLPQGAVAAALQRLLGVPFLVTSHGADLYALRRRLIERAKRGVLARAAGLTTVSASLRDEMVRLGAPPDRVSVVPMGVDRQRFAPTAADPAIRARLNADGPALLFVGRLAEKKGARYAVEAMPMVLASNPTARLSLIGDGPERESIRVLIDRLGLRRHVSLLGAVAHDSLPAYFASADVALAPSIEGSDGDTEAFGLVLAEAMACGCPVVASDVGGVRDVVNDGESGLLVRQRDPVALALSVNRLLSDGRLRERIGAAGLARAAEFDAERIAQRYGDLIEGIVR